MPRAVEIASRPYIRAARASDREAVLRFSEHTWEWGDYIAQVWDSWLDDPTGKLLIATVDRQPVAVAHVVMAAPGEAWLEGLRVDPACRGMGVAKTMTQRCLREAVAMGADIVRFATSSANVIIHHTGEGLGFTRRATIVPCRAESLHKQDPSVQAPEPRHLPLLLAFLAGSSVFAAMGGLFSTGWRFHSLTNDQLQERLNNGQVRVITRSEGIGAMAIIETGIYGEGLVIEYADGYSDESTSLALGLRREAADFEPPQVSARIPDAPEIQMAFRNAGYEQQTEHSFWVYERALHAPSQRKPERQDE